MPPLERGGVYLPALKGKIFDIIRKHAGISTEDLAQKVYGSTGLRVRVRLRVHIAQINDLLAGSDMSISGDGAYRHGDSDYGRGEYRIVRPDDVRPVRRRSGALSSKRQKPPPRSS